MALAEMLATALILSACGTQESEPLVVDRESREVRFSAVSRAAQWNRSEWGTPGHHAITWKGGRGGPVLFETSVRDLDVSRALRGLGAEPGNNLTQETWDERFDGEAQAPRERVAGSKVEILLEWPGSGGEIPLGDVVEAPGHRGVSMRYGGNEELIPVWRSGCIVCLQSCPGAKISNSRYSIRDYVEGSGRFRAREDRLPPDGTVVTVIIRLAPDSEEDETGQGG